MATFREPGESHETIARYSAKQESFDAKQIERKVEAVSRELVILRVVTGFLFVVIFGLFPVVASIRGVGGALLAVVPLVVTASVSSAVLYFRKAQILSPEISTVVLYGNAVKLSLYPISALRAVELLSYRVLSSYDPIVPCLQGVPNDETRSDRAVCLSAKTPGFRFHRSAQDHRGGFAYLLSELWRTVRIDGREVYRLPEYFASAHAEDKYSDHEGRRPEPWEMSRGWLWSAEC
jgi:hypothetical protein